MNTKISQDLIRGAFGKHPHNIYMAYDELTDELILRLIDPSVLAYVFELKNNDRYALLVEAESNEIIGFQLFNFQRDHLQEMTWENLRSDWDNALRLNREHGYIMLRYDPNQNKIKVEGHSLLIENANMFRDEFQKTLA